MLIRQLKRTLALGLFLAVLVTPALAATAEPEFVANRARLISYLLREQLSQHHYSHKALDDELSLAAFELYLKQLDPQKRFLLQRDVARLRAFAARIDDELNQGRFELPTLGAALFRERVGQVRQMVEELLAGEVDFSVREELETDSAKLSFCADPQELRERWRKALKYQVLNRYLNLLEDEGLRASDAGAARPLKKPWITQMDKAREKVLKSNLDFLTRLAEDTEQDHFDRYFDAVARAFDPHTGYLPPAQKEDFDIGMRGSLEGIGATLREEDGYIKVVSIIPGSPSARQGQLHAEDVILMVAQGNGEPVDVTDTRLRDAVALIRGPKGTEVRLTVKKPDGARLVIPIVRDVVQIEETFVKSALLTEERGGRTYGYIKVPSFYRDFQKMRAGEAGRNVTDDIRAELEKLKAQKISGLILDLRNNGGGALTDAVAVTGLFIEKGPVVQVKNSYGKIETLADEDASVAYAGPLVVLVNQFSASASEIVAGALQDYGRALILGAEHTHGKGTVQAVVDLDRALPFPNMASYQPLGAMRVTIQKFYRVSGASTQYRGVGSDIVLPDRLGHLKSGESYLDHSLPWDTVNPTPFSSWGRSETNLPALRARSQQRVTADREFEEIVKEARQAASRMEMTVQSLLFDDVRRERDEAKKLLKKGAHGEEPGDDEVAEGHGRPGDTADPAEMRRKWLEEVSNDPYAREAMGVLSDQLGAPAATPQPVVTAPADRSSYSRRLRPPGPSAASDSGI
jgi:carboxyl-terminal processing protease